MSSPISNPLGIGRLTRVTVRFAGPAIASATPFFAFGSISGLVVGSQKRSCIYQFLCLLIIRLAAGSVAAHDLVVVGPAGSP